MKELIAGKNEAGVSLKKVVSKYLDQAPTAFIYKMLRKKNITLNKKKADGSEILAEKDVIQLFLSDETIEKFRSGRSNKTVSEKERAGKVESKKPSGYQAYKNRISIIFEDEDIIAAEKPVGMLSQKAVDTDYSMNEYLIDHLLASKQITEKSLETFRPSVCNRLDRNTSGIILFGKSLKGSRCLSEMIRERTIDKFYLTAVYGTFPTVKKDTAYLSKNQEKNLVEVISEEAYHRLPMDKRGVYSKIQTEYKKLYNENGLSLLEVKLITGKSHQIRAHLKYLGFSVVGDTKYKDDSIKREKIPGIRSQLLHAYRVVFLKNASLHAGKEIRTTIPDSFRKLFSGYHF